MTNSLSDADLRKFAALVRQKTGMVIDESKRRILETRLEERIRALSLPGPAEYYDLIWFSSDGQEELKELIDAMLINETLFYRNIPQMEILEELVFPAMIRRRISDAAQPTRAEVPNGLNVERRTRPPADAEPIRVWSAGASTGAEAFSIVMAFEEAKSRVGLSAAAVQISVLGTDISNRALATAAEAVYPARPVDNAPPEIVSRYFLREDAEYRVTDPIRRAVSFRQHNLLDAAFPDGFDLIFCRNVMIYFDAATREQVVEKFYHSLNSDGVIFIGHTETLLDWPECFQPRHHGDAIYYEKWSTDRRQAARSGKTPAAVSDRRHPVEEKPPAEILIEERPLMVNALPMAHTLAIQGILDANCPRDMFKERMLLFLAKPAAVKVLDLAGVPFVSNEFIRVLRQALAVMKSEGVRPFILCPTTEFLRHFQTAALDQFAALVETRAHLVREIGALRKSQPSGAAVSRPPSTHSVPPRTPRPAARIPEGSALKRKKETATVSVRYENGHAGVMLEGCLDSSGCPETGSATGPGDLPDRIKQAFASIIRRRPADLSSISVNIENATCLSFDIVTLLSRAAVLAREHSLPFRVVVGDEKILRFLARHLSRTDMAFKLEYAEETGVQRSTFKVQGFND